jgi:hypothetical protein
MKKKQIFSSTIFCFDHDYDYIQTTQQCINNSIEGTHISSIFCEIQHATKMHCSFWQFSAWKKPSISCTPTENRNQKIASGPRCCAHYKTSSAKFLPKKRTTYNFLTRITKQKTLCVKVLHSFSTNADIATILWQKFVDKPAKYMSRQYFAANTQFCCFRHEWMMPLFHTTQLIYTLKNDNLSTIIRRWISPTIYSN